MQSLYIDHQLNTKCYKVEKVEE